jgi:hypothetical protein
MGLESILAPFMQQAEIYGSDDYLLGHTGTAERSANAPITARRPADLSGNLVAKLAARCHAEPGDLCPATCRAERVDRRLDLLRRGLPVCGSFPGKLVS